MNFEKLPTLKTVFQKDGTVTAANASKLSDGAATLILMSEQKAKDMTIKPLARIKAFADSETVPIDFPISPQFSVNKVLQSADMKITDIDYWEINEAFSVVPLINMKILGLNHSIVNIYGGAVSLGHPIGASGARILVTLLNVLKQKGSKYGCASICNGGGGSTSIIIEKM